jgi:hypothetical protein
MEQRPLFPESAAPRRFKDIDNTFRKIVLQEVYPVVVLGLKPAPARSASLPCGIIKIFAALPGQDSPCHPILEKSPNNRLT